MYKPECAIHQEKVKQYNLKTSMTIVSIKIHSIAISVDTLRLRTRSC